MIMIIKGATPWNNKFSVQLSTGEIKELTEKVDKAYKRCELDYDDIDTEPLKFTYKKFLEALPAHSEWKEIKPGEWYDFKLDLPIILLNDYET